MEGPKLGHLKDLGVASEEFVGIKITACESGEEDSDLEKVDQGELEKQYKADLCSPQTLALTKITKLIFSRSHHPCLAYDYQFVFANLRLHP